MKIYLVRHGQTGGNVAHRHQHVDTALTSLGQEQAITAAEQVKKNKPTHLVSSSMVRAIETARVIGTACDLVPETNYRFAELKRPKKLYGNYHRSFRSIVFYAQWYLGINSSYLLDGESYRQLRERIEEAKRYIEESYLPEDSVVIVSHTVFINFFTAHLCKSSRLPLPEALSVFKRVLTMPNAKITEINYDHSLPEHTCRWSLKS